MADEKDSAQNERENHEEVQERQHFEKIVKAFLFYKDYSANKLDRVKSGYRRLPVRHRRLLPNLESHFKQVEDCIATNYKFICRIVGNTGHIFENRSDFERDTGDELPNGLKTGQSVVNGFDMEKVLTTVRQFVRDWSEEGQEERNSCYKPIIEEIKGLFPPEECSVADISILVPGAGLARLLHEIAKLGYRCQGNEWSLFMLVASHYILNKMQYDKDLDRGEEKQPEVTHKTTTIYPYVHQTCNNMTSSDQLRPIVVPDIDPSDLPQATNFSMVAGNFLDVYTEKDEWDCVATCFFIDTSHNVIDYIEKIYNVLKPGGYWINLGPLLYHFAEIPNEWSVELSYEEIRRIITEHFNFELVKENTNVPTTYMQNSRSMMKMVYECVFFVARKPL